MTKIYAGELVELALQLKHNRDQDGSTPLLPSDIRDSFRILRNETGEGASYASSIHQGLDGGAGMCSGMKGRRIGIGR